MKNGGQRKPDCRHVLDLVFFEQWLRFYFLEEENGALYIRMPEDVYRLTELEHPELFQIAAALNGREVDHQSALTVLSECLLNGQSGLDGGQWAEILRGAEFRNSLQLLSYWVQAEEERLDRELIPFSAWRALFDEWLLTPTVRDYAARLLAADDGNPEHEALGKVQ